MTRRRVALALVALVVLAAAGGASAWWWNERQTRDVRGSADVEFADAEPPGTTRPEEEVREEPWPTYGFDAARTRFAADFDHRPPYRRVWTFDARRLLEFSPVIAYGRLYVANIAGDLFAVDASTGKSVWEKQFRRFSAASPTVGDGVVYHPLMNARDEDRAKAPGYLVAVDAESGKELWRFEAGVIESSPLLVGRTIYFGSFDDRLYALDVRTRRVRWTYETGDDVKGGPVLLRGTIYFGSYDGKVYAVDARTGKLRWESGAQGGLRGTGNFYATPAVAYGRVFVGNTDGKVYAFGARSGKLLWSHTTGGYVYSAAAVWDKSVYVGSHDRRLYALDAATGDVRWSFEANDRVSGAPTVLAGIVYFSTVGGRTYGLDARTGKEAWTFPDGEYTPIVADEERVYLTGHRRVYGLEPR
jgi:outer membrane protein assembly factor BamB